MRQTITNTLFTSTILTAILSNPIQFATVGASPAKPAEKFRSQAVANPDQPYHLVIVPTQKVRGVLVSELQAPHLDAARWAVIAPSAPELNCQKMAHTTLEVSSLVGPVTQGKELSPLARPVLSFQAPVQPPILGNCLKTTAAYTAILYSVKLVPGRAIRMARDLAMAERQLFLRPSKTVDWDAPRFRQWLKDKGLLRSKDESSLAFAYRAFHAVAESLEYQYPTEDRRASAVCGSSKTDCGGMAAFFTAICRANDVPARPLVGRWATSQVEGNEQIHVKAEFFAKNIGWVPVDLSMAQAAGKNHPNDADRFFGTFNGDFLVMHIDCDFLIDSVWFGSKEEPWIQAPVYWAVGRGTFDDAVNVKRWSVKTISKYGKR